MLMIQKGWPAKVGEGVRAGTGIVALAALGLCVSAAPGAAQTQQPDLRAEQERLFEAMFEDPDNLELMFGHALVSVELGDYEAAISTLERMLIFNPALSRAKVELGAAYFRLGAYENARYYFEDVLETSDPPPEVVGRVNRFLDEIQRRTAKSGFAGAASVGLTFSTNANLGPSDPDVLLGGGPAVLQDEFLSDDDIGVRAALNGTHYYDLDQPDGDVWRTDVSAITIHYLEESRGDIDSLAFRTGPRLSLDDRSFGPKIRPFVEGDALRANNEMLYATIGAGVTVTDTVSDELNVSATLRSGWREYFNGRDGFDGSTHRANAAATYALSKDATLFGGVFVEGDLAADDQNTNIEFGARIGGAFNYDSGFEFTDRLWTVTTYAQGALRYFEEPNPAVDPNRKRNDRDFRVGASHTFHLNEGLFVQADADYLVRDSNLPNFDLNTLGLTLSIGQTF